MNRRPRVAWVIPTMRVGGTELQLLRLMQGLKDEFEFTLICTRSEGALIGDARRMGAYVRVLDARGGWDFRVERRIYGVLRTHTPEVLHTFMSGFDLYPNRAARDAEVPVIVSSRRELATWQKRRHLFMQNRANRFVDAIVANSKAVADYAMNREKADPRLFHVIHNGVSVDEFQTPNSKEHLRSRFKLPEDAFIVGVVANFTPVKDHQLFTDIADVLIKRGRNVHFLLVGTGPLVSQVGRILKRRRQRRHVTRLTTVGELGDLYGVMDASLLCSKVEGFPNAVIESMAAKRPPVAPNIGGIAELIQDGETGRLIGTRDPADFADAIEHLMDHDEERAAMGERAHAWVRDNLSLEKMVDSYRRLYFDLIQRKTSKRGR